MNLADIGRLAVTELDAARDPHLTDERAIRHALISIAASLYRQQAVPAVPSNYPLRPDPLDHDGADPFQSATETYWDDKTERRLERD